MIWGVHTIHAVEPKSFSGMIENACDLAKKEGIVKKGDYVVITAGAPIGVSGSTNNLRLQNKLALSGFKPRIGFVDYVKSAFSFNNSTISVS